ncbi:MAG: nodulation protein NfeD [Spirochaetales bacterium]|nr:nodulation protein NfeD [Spirochaetales bacterium]
MNTTPFRCVCGFRRLVLAVAALAVLPLFAAGAQGAYIIPIEGDIEPSTAVFVRRQATKALEAGATELIFEIDTFGGRVDSALRISSFIGSIRDARTTAWVRSGPDSLGVSWSAGALIAMSCSRLYMAPGTSIGAAAPVVAGADGQMEGAGEKTVSAVRAQMAALAEKNGYPQAIALAMVDADIVLYEARSGERVELLTLEELEAAEKANPATIRGKLVSGAGKLLSLTAGEAERYGLSSGTIDDAEAILTALGAPAPAVELSPSIADSIVVLLSSAAVQSILILIGLVAIFLEINTPGFGLPGTVALVSFLVLFGTNALMGSVGSIELILFMLGVGLLAVEIFVLPGFGVTGISGIVLIGASLVLSMQDFVVPTLDWEWELLGRNVLTVSVGLMSAIVAIGLLALAGPRIKLFDRLTLRTTISDTAGGSLAADAQSAAASQGDHPLVGKRGTAVTTLRPSGRAMIDGTVRSVETDGSFVEQGQELVVVAVHGSRIVVSVV